MKTILIVDGICPRGLAIIRYLSATGEYHILVFTKSTTCPGAAAANALPGVTLLLNRASSGYDLQTFVAAAQRCPNILVCSSVANSEGREGVQWGARLVQSAFSASTRHLVFLSMERERKQFSTDNYLATQSKASMTWTIIRSPPAEATSSDPERSLSATQLRNLAYYVTWVFTHSDRSTGLDFVLPKAEPSGMSTSPESRRDSRMSISAAPSTSSYHVEGGKPHPARQASTASSSARATVSRADSGGVRSASMDAGRAKDIQQWVAKTSPVLQEESEESDDEDDDESSGCESA